MKFKNLIAASIVLFMFFLLTVAGVCAGDGKVTMDQWLKIINPGGAEKISPPQTSETDNEGIIDSSITAGAQGIAVTIYWHMADAADVYLNGKPLRQYQPSFKTRPDEAPRPAFSAIATLRDGDVFTVGGRRGGSFGLMLIAADSAGRIVFQTDQLSWKIYEPGDRADWYNPQVAMTSPTQPVTVQTNPWHPQKELNAKFGNKALSIWSTPANRFSYLYGIVGGISKAADSISVANIEEKGTPKQTANNHPSEDGKSSFAAPHITPFTIQEPLDINKLSVAQYNGAITAAMETMRLIMGDFSSDEEKRFRTKWGAYFDFPTEESVAYFNKLNPLLAEFLSLRAAIATAAVEFDGAWEEAVIAAGYESEDGIREGLSIAETQKKQLLSMKARLEQIVSEIKALGNPPDAQDAKKKIKKKHDDALKITRKIIKAASKTGEKTVPPLKQSGIIKITPSSSVAEGGTFIEFSADVPPDIAKKTTLYYWQSWGGWIGSDINAHYTTSPRITMFYPHSPGTWEPGLAMVNLEAHQVKGKSIASGRVYLPVRRLHIQDIKVPEPFSGGVEFDNAIKSRRHLQMKTNLPNEYPRKDLDSRRSDIPRIENYSYLTVKIDVLNKTDKEYRLRDISNMSKPDSKEFYFITQQKISVDMGTFAGEIIESTQRSTKNIGWAEGSQWHTFGKGLLTLKKDVPSGYNGSLDYVWIEYEVKSTCANCRKKQYGDYSGLSEKWAQEMLRKIVATINAVKIDYDADQGLPPESADEMDKIDPEAIKKTIAFHQSNIKIIEKNLAKDQAELAREIDSIRRSSLEFRILTARSDIQAEKDLIASLQTGQIIHTRTPFDDYVQAQFINNVKDNQRRMEDFQRTTAALNRLAGMLPGDEAEKAREFVKRQLPLSSMANMDKEKAKRVAGALGEKVQGYYLSDAAKEDEKAAWANFGMEAAQNIKTAADTGLTITSMMGGRGVMIAYQGVTGYVDGGPVEAVSRAAFFYSTPTAVAADAFKGYQESGWKGAAKNAAFTFITSKAFEYGAKKLGGATGQSSTKSKPTVKEQFTQTQFQQARQDGESLAKDFSRAQGNLDRLGKTGASAAEILKQQKIVRDMAASVNSSPHAKNYLKYKGDYHSQKAYNAHMKTTHADVEAKFHEEMSRRGWNKQDLKEFRNAASAGSVGMDHDIGLIEKPHWITSDGGKMSRNNWLTQNGKSQTIEKWQIDAQKAWDKAYHNTTGRNAKQAWETVTTSKHLESYRDLNLLGADKSKVQAIWAQQSADVTRYKMQHMLHDPALSKMEAFQEVSRGAAKDMNTKLIPLMEQAKAQGDLSSKALADSKRHWQKVQSVLDAFGKNDLDPITAQRRIRELTGKDIPEVVDDASLLLESMIKEKK